MHDTIDEDDRGEQTVRKIVPNISFEDVFGRREEPLEQVESDMIIDCYPIASAADSAE